MTKLNYWICGDNQTFWKSIEFSKKKGQWKEIEIVVLMSQSKLWWGELVGIYLISKKSQIVCKNHTSLYKDDGLILKKVQVISIV